MINEDLSERQDARPWYYPIDGDLRMVGSVGDLVTIARMTKVGRAVAHNTIGALERVGLMPRGTRKTADSLALAADCLVKGAKMGLFTPMYLMVGRKPMA